MSFRAGRTFLHLNAHQRQVTTGLIITRSTYLLRDHRNGCRHRHLHVHCGGNTGWSPREEFRGSHSAYYPAFPSLTTITILGSPYRRLPKSILDNRQATRSLSPDTHRTTRTRNPGSPTALRASAPPEAKTGRVTRFPRVGTDARVG